MSTYCKDCDNHIPQLNELVNLTDPPYEDGKNICKATLKFKVNPIGETILRRHQDDEKCGECGCILHGAGRIIYEKCIRKNANLNCPDFKKKSFIKKILRRY